MAIQRSQHRTRWRACRDDGINDRNRIGDRLAKTKRNSGTAFSLEFPRSVERVYVESRVGFSKAKADCRQPAAHRMPVTASVTRESHAFLRQIRTCVGDRATQASGWLSRSGLNHRPQIGRILRAGGCIARLQFENLARRSGVSFRTRPLRLARLAKPLKVVQTFCTKTNRELREVDFTDRNVAGR